MKRFPIATHFLRTIFNAEDGLSEDFSRRLYVRSVHTTGQTEALKVELQAAFADPDVSWKDLLLNADYEVFDAQYEGEAKAYARRILWEPMF